MPINIDKVNEERKHLETLHQTRINFYLVFAGILLAGSYNVHEVSVKRGVLMVGFLVSLLILFAVVRTFRLVERALSQIRADGSLPYAVYYREIRFPPDANILLLLVPCVITILFFWLTIRAFGCG